MQGATLGGEQNTTAATAELLETAKAAAVLGVDRTMVGRFVAAGRLEVALAAPGSRGAKFYRRADIDALAAERAKTRTAAPQT